MRRIVLFLSAALLPVASASAQSSFPTPGNTAVPGSVPLQCNSSNAACAPVTAANPLQVAVVSGGGGGGSSGGTATAASPTYTEGATSQALSLDLSGRLRTLASQNGTWTVGLSGVVTTANFTTPAGTTQYTAGQLIANSATAGSVTPLSLTVCRVNGGTFQIDRVRVHTPDTGAAGQTVKVELYQSAPTFANGDHGTWLTTESGYLGEAIVTLGYTFSDQVKGIGVPLGGIIKGSCAGGLERDLCGAAGGHADYPAGRETVECHHRSDGELRCCAGS